MSACGRCRFDQHADLNKRGSGAQVDLGFVID